MAQGAVGFLYHTCPNENVGSLSDMFLLIAVAYSCQKIHQNRHPDVRHKIFHPVRKQTSKQTNKKEKQTKKQMNKQTDKQKITQTRKEINKEISPGLCNGVLYWSTRCSQHVCTQGDSRYLDCFWSSTSSLYSYSSYSGNRKSKKNCLFSSL